MRIIAYSVNYINYFDYFDYSNYSFLLLFAVLPDQPPSPEQQPLPDPPDLSPPSFRQPEHAGRQRARAAVRPVIIPNVLRQTAQGDVARVIRDFDRSYMPEEGFPDSIVPDVDAHDYRSRLKRKAADITRSCCEVFAYLTFDTSSQAQASRLLQMITNVSPK